MFRSKARAALLLLAAGWLPACVVPAPLATMEATVVSGSNGEQSSLVQINFTDFESSVDEGGSLHMTFSNSDGDSMTFVLAPDGGTFPVKSYTIDGTSNTFNATIVLVVNMQPSPVAVTSTNGFVNLKAVNMNGSTLVSVGGDYKVNFTGGGVGQGLFNTASN